MIGSVNRARWKCTEIKVELEGGGGLKKQNIDTGRQEKRKRMGKCLSNSSYVSFIFFSEQKKCSLPFSMEGWISKIINETQVFMLNLNFLNYKHGI